MNGQQPVERVIPYRLFVFDLFKEARRSFLSCVESFSPRGVFFHCNGGRALH